MNIIDISVVNAVVLYSMMNKIMLQQEVSLRIVHLYMKTPLMSGPQNFSCPSLCENTQLHVPGEVRRINSGHAFETHKVPYTKCVVCKDNVRKQGTKCKLCNM